MRQIIRTIATGIGVFVLVEGRGLVANAQARTPIAHWPLVENTDDHGPHRLRTENHAVESSGGKKLDDRPAGANWNGRTSQLRVDAAPIADALAKEFSLALWVHTDAKGGDEPGDLISHFDSDRRVGFQLGLQTNAGVTSCQANSRQLQFGIDAGSAPAWRDEGKPGAALFAFALATHNGALYAGTCEPAADAAGHVYRYEGPDNWRDLGSPDKANAVSAMAEYRGQLYVGSAKYRLAGSALTESENPHDGGKIFRLEHGDRWQEAGRLADDQIAVGGMAVYRDRLYASSLYKPAGFYRYEEDGRWTSLPTPDGLRVEALGLFDGYLWASSYDGGYVFRFDGEQWKSFGVLGDNSQTYSFAVHQGRLCVGSWPSGRVYRLAADETWEDLGRLGEEKEVMGMLVYNGKLYGGTLPLAEVYRFDGRQTWTNVGRLDRTPDVTYRRAWTMAEFQGRVFVSTLPAGKIHSLEAGKCASYDASFPTGWKHIAAVRDAGRLRLYVDGRQAAESTTFDPAAFRLKPDVPLLIGAGAGDRWCGQLRDVRIYDAALTPEEVATLAKP